MLVSKEPLLLRGSLTFPPFSQRSYVKHARGDHFWPAARQFPAQIFKGNIRKTVVSQNRRKKHETFIEISKRKQKWEKRKLETFLSQRLFKYEYSVDLPFCFKIYQKSNTLLKLRGLLL